MTILHWRIVISYIFEMKSHAVFHKFETIFRRAKNETYGVGEEWNDGCELKCVCNDKVEIVCQERCKVIEGLNLRRTNFLS